MGDCIELVLPRALCSSMWRSGQGARLTYEVDGSKTVGCGTPCAGGLRVMLGGHPASFSTSAEQECGSRRQQGEESFCPPLRRRVATPGIGCWSLWAGIMPTYLEVSGKPPAQTLWVRLLRGGRSLTQGSSQGMLHVMQSLQDRRFCRTGSHELDFGVERCRLDFGVKRLDWPPASSADRNHTHGVGCFLSTKWGTRG